MNNNRLGLAGLGGWLYADLLLILFIGVLTQLPTTKPTQTATPMPTPAAEQSLSRRSIRFTVPIPMSLSTSSSVEGQVNFLARCTHC